MSDNTMPNNLWIEYRRGYAGVSKRNIDGMTEYIRADALRAKLGGYRDSDLLSLAESLRTFHDNAEATMERLQEENSLQRDVIAAQKQRLWELQQRIVERDATIAELAASLAGRYDLHALQVCADAATTEAEDYKPLFDGEAINWGDLGCVGAEWYVNDNDVTGYRVIIEEADPRSYRLRDFIREYLTEHGFVDIDVILEW